MYGEFSKCLEYLDVFVEEICDVYYMLFWRMNVAACDIMLMLSCRAMQGFGEGMQKFTISSDL